MPDRTRILLVEDNPDHALIATDALRAADAAYEIQHCADFDACLGHLDGPAPDLLLIDYSLPGGRDGLLLMREISKQSTPPPMIMVTGQGDEAVAVGAMKLGAHDYVVKGPDFRRRLPVVVKQALQQHALRQELDRSRESILRRNRELSALNALNAAIRRLQDPAEVRAVALRTLTELLEAECAAFFQGTPADGFAPVATHCLSHDLETQLAGLTLPPGSVAAEALQDQRARIERTLAPPDPADPESRTSPDLSQLAARMGFRSWVVLPLASGTHRSSVVVLGSRGPTFPAIDDPAVLTTLGDQLAVAHENARLYQEVHRAARELEGKVAARTGELEEAYARLSLVDRRKTEFLAAMSHELRTPLNSIIGFTGAMLKGLSGGVNAEQAKQLTIVYDSARNLLDLINDLLDLSKIEAGRIELRPEGFPLASLLTEFGEIAERLVGSRPIAIEVDAAPEIPPLFTDRGKLRQILLNLLSNAAKYTAAGRIAILATLDGDHRLDAGGPAITVLRIEVLDTGCGIVEDQHTQIFEEFHQVPPPPGATDAMGGPGTGLGLAISQKLARALGETITVTSEPGQGSRFTVLLPLAGVTAT